MEVKKAIIPAAGLGTRFLPASKAQPKEMLPIVDKPTIQYIVEEAVASGIDDILIVSGRGKRAIEDHFDKSFELEEVLEQKGKQEELEMIRHISNLANIYYIRQKEPRGLGHAIWCARKFIGNDPFAVLLGDDIVESSKPCLAQLIEIFHQVQSPIVGVQVVDWEEVSKYGIIVPDSEAEEQKQNVMEVLKMMEKPAREEAPSNYAIMGRYILTADIFDILEHQQPGAGGEIQLTDAINALNAFRPVYAYAFEGNRYDVGNKFGFIKATLDFALRRKDLRDEVMDYIKYIVQLEEQKRI